MSCKCKTTEIACNSCNQAPCQPSTPCDCPAGMFSTDCLTVSTEFECFAIESGQTLTETLSQMEQATCALFESQTNYLTIVNVGGGAEVYKGTSGTGQKQLRTLTSTDGSVTIDEQEDTINLSSPNTTCIVSADKSVTITEEEGCFNLSVTHPDIANVGGEVALYKGYNSISNEHEFKTMYSDDIIVTDETNKIKLSLPSTFEGTDYYVNSNYPGTVELGTASKPFKTLKRCIDKILNRGIENSPDINGGAVYEKYENRGNQNIRVVIQSYSETDENLAINRVTYFLERGIGNSTIQVLATGSGAFLERIIDMRELVDAIPKVAGELPYEINTTLMGKGQVGFGYGHPNRKGYVRAYGYSQGITEQFDCNLFIGSVEGDLLFFMSKNPSLPYIPLYSDVGDTIPIVRESIAMTGLLDNELVDYNYGAIEAEQPNAQFQDSLILSGNIQIEAFEQNIVRATEGGTIYGSEGRLIFRRSYRDVNYSSVDNALVVVPGSPPLTIKSYLPSRKVSDIVLINKAILSYAGEIYTQENTSMNQGGSEAFVYIENNTTSIENMCTLRLSGGGVLAGILYNHYIKNSLNPYWQGVGLENKSSYIEITNLRLSSSIFEEAISVKTTSDTDWTSNLTIGKFVNLYLNDFLPYAVVRKPISNIAINSKIYFTGTPIELGIGTFKPNIPSYANNAAAVSNNYPIGGEYKDATGTLKIVI